MDTPVIEPDIPTWCRCPYCGVEQPFRKGKEHWKRGKVPNLTGPTVQNVRVVYARCSHEAWGQVLQYDIKVRGMQKGENIFRFFVSKDTGAPGEPFMARPLRIEYENAVYHITSRGNEQQAIYRSDKDRRRFLDILGDVVKRYRWICHAYCLMDNHYHLLIETPLANISRGMRHLNGVYTQAFNYVHRRVGHLFQGRFRGILVEKQEHLLEVARYIVLNPVRARVCDRAEDYLWSSYNGTVGRMDCPDFLYPDWILSQFGTSERLEAQARYERFVRDGIEGNPWEELKGQIYLGSEAFVRSLQEYHSESEEIPRAQRNPLRIDLKTLLKTEEGIRRAYHEHWYSLKEIAAHLGVHYATISRRLKRLEEKETKLLAMLHCKT